MVRSLEHVGPGTPTSAIEASGLGAGRIMKSTQSNVATLDRLYGALDPARRPGKLSESRFDETHELFERSSSQQQLILDWLTELILEQYANIDPLKILSVRCIRYVSTRSRST